LATLGETVAEPKVVGKFLRSVPHKYKQIVVAIQTLLDVETLTLTNVTGQLKAEDVLEAPPASANHAGKLYLSEEACEEKWKVQEGSDSGGSRSRGGGGHGADRDRSRGRGNGGTTTIPAIHLRLDRARWGTTSAASVAKRGTWRVIAGPSRRRRRHTLRKRKNP
jgi:hypothetical protein